MIFSLLMCFLIIQRLSEIHLGKKNLGFMLDKLLVEVSLSEKKQMMLLHTGWFITSFTEYYFVGSLIETLYFNLGILVLTLCQILRYKTIDQLGKYWVPLPVSFKDQEIITSGPYRYIRHPNYLCVIVEIILVPLLGKCYLTALIFGCLNIAFLCRRMKIEEDALRLVPEYGTAFSAKKKLIPFIY